MSAIPQPNSPFTISDRITAPLKEVAQRQWFVLAAAGAADVDREPVGAAGGGVLAGDVSAFAVCVAGAAGGGDVGCGALGGGSVFEAGLRKWTLSEAARKELKRPPRGTRSG